VCVCVCVCVFVFVFVQNADNVKWPDFMQSMMSQMKLALLDIYQVASVDCLAPMDFYTPYWLTCSITFGVLLAAAALHRVLPTLVRFCCRSADIDWIRWLQSSVVKYTSIFMTVLYPGMCVDCVSLWSSCLSLNCWCWSLFC
jgi:hypothetical protein